MQTKILRLVWVAAGMILIFSTGTGCKDSHGKKEIVIGHQADLTGGISSWGYWIEKGSRHAVEEINAAGGINGHLLKYVVEDTETNPTVGSRKFRKLALQDDAAVILGSVHSGVMMATVPLAQELKTPYFPLGMAYEATGPMGNRYVFRINSQVREQEAASAKWMVANVAKKWTIVVTDYAWGHSHENWFEKGIQENGGSVLAKVRIPQGTKDFLPYLSNIPKETEGIYYIFFGADTLGFLSQITDYGYRGAKFTMICSLEAIDVTKLGAAVEGMYVVEYMPREFSQQETPFNRAYRQALGVDPHGGEVGNPSRVVAGSHYWAAYEHVYMIKQAMERCHWESKEDNPKLLAALESIKEVQEGDHFPQGTAMFRAQDHQGFHQHYMSQIQNGHLMVQFRIPTSDVVYPPETNFPLEKP